MWIYGIVVVLATAMACSEAKPMELEEFMSSLAGKQDVNKNDETQETPQVKEEELLQFVKRSGLIAEPQQEPSEDTSSNSEGSNQNLLTVLKALRNSLNRQQSIMAYSPDYAQASSLASTQQRSSRAVNIAPQNFDTNAVYSYQKPKSKEAPAGLSKNQHSNPATIQSLPQQRSQPQYYPQYVGSSAPAASQKQIPQRIVGVQTGDANTNLAYANNQQTISSINDKSSMKDDRQGHYAYEAPSGHDGVYTHARTPAHYDSHYAPEPEGYHNKHLNFPSIAIKFDPLGLLKLLFSGLPKPLFGLNGKIFLGIELGKGAGLSVGKGQFGGGHHGGGRVITIG